MLFDPKWEVETKADPFTPHHFISWLETKPPKETYNFDDCKGRCLMGQYMADHQMSYNDDNYKKACADVFGNWMSVPVLVRRPYTFGAALERARKALSA